MRARAVLAVLALTACVEKTPSRRPPPDAAPASQRLRALDAGGAIRLELTGSFRTSFDVSGPAGLVARVTPDGSALVARDEHGLELLRLRPDLELHDRVGTRAGWLSDKDGVIRVLDEIGVAGADVRLEDGAAVLRDAGGSVVARIRPVAGRLAAERPDGSAYGYVSGTSDVVVGALLLADKLSPLVRGLVVGWAARRAR